MYLSFVPVDVPMTEEEKGPEIKFPLLPKPYPPEIEAFAVLVLQMWLGDKKEKGKALQCVEALVPWLKTFNRRTLDIFSARAYFYLSLLYEREGRLAEIRPELLAA